MYHLDDVINADPTRSGLSFAPQVNMTLPGQNGHNPDAYYLNASAPYLQGQMITKVLEGPGFMDYLPNGTELKLAWKALIETHAQSITGIDSTLSTEWSQQNIGRDGQMLESVTRVQIAQVALSISLQDRLGRPVQRMYEDWIRTAYMNEQTGYAGIVNRNDLVRALPNNFGPWFTGGTLIGFEPDPTMQFADKAVLLIAVSPKAAGENKMQLDITAAKTPNELSIEHTAYAVRGEGVTALAQRYLESMNLRNANPLRAQSPIPGAEAVLAEQGHGYLEGIKDLIANQYGTGFTQGARGIFR
jgi:hypothetical protein